MSRKMTIAVVATAVSFVAAGAASARSGGGAHGSVHGMPGGAVTVNAPAGGALTHQSTGTTSTGASGASMATPKFNIDPDLFAKGAGTVSVPNAPNAGASPGAIGGVPPSSPNGGGHNNLGTNPNGRGLSLTGAPPDGTNTAGAALSSGLPTNSKSDVTTGSAQSADSVKLRRAKDEERAREAENLNRTEAAKIDRVVKSVCKGCY
jgi:hypothetical protein